MQIKETRWNRSVVWDNYKAGVIDADTGRIIVPVRFDELYWRVQTFRSLEPGIPPNPPALIGFACFTDEGEAMACDADGNIDEWKDWEHGRLASPELPKQSLEEIEREINRLYHVENAGRDELSDLFYARRRLLNHSWQHSPDNVKAICRVNDRLNAAVREALKMGESLEKTLTGDWSLEVEVYPEWKDESIQNIIVEMGRNVGVTDHSPCFRIYSTKERPAAWDFKTATLDDGNSWDEGGFHRPAYQDCYFLHPFQQLCTDNYIFAFSDLLTIESFQINALITRYSEK